MHKRAFLLTICLLASCSTTPEALEASKDAVRAQRKYSENYQEIYRRVSTAARSCVSSNINAYASFEIDSSLYNELGFGEVTLSLLNMGGRNYYWKAKISKAGSGSIMAVTAGNTLSKNSMINDVVGGAAGGTACTNR